MSDVLIRTEGRAGRITLNRPKALNALTHEMCLAIDAALIAWARDPAVALVLIDGAGEKAFCAGGDIARMYEAGRAGDFHWPRQFWRDEYRMNARLYHYRKPVVSFLQGFTMGGGVGVGCHGSHRVVGESSRIAMPEAGIGLVPDVGGSLLLARAPGRVGEYLGVTAGRMAAGDAIFAGFADHFVPEAEWPALAAELAATGEVDRIAAAATAPPAADLEGRQADIDRLFAAESWEALRAALAGDPSDTAQAAAAALDKVSPLSAALTLELVRQVRRLDSIEGALDMEYRVTSRAMEHGDLMEGVRAMIVDKDHAPRWMPFDPAKVQRMLAPVTENGLDLGGTT
ncbi:enoyl-CoA hydratase/isomerase family protein [Oceaniglobus roseus]|uniref:enoyl-CoA hydratase/isomerase family protein n=1 Tax=Oceaniglobus roseus TaxID=1737570 RepID=UPI000C7F4A2C|nr:enoyl-CoA hydratase/isomerase family protein [Kandeliimicrobium roseum]